MIGASLMKTISPNNQTQAEFNPQERQTIKEYLSIVRKNLKRAKKLADKNPKMFEKMGQSKFS